MHFPSTRAFFSALLAVVLLGAAASPAQAQLGVTGGLNFASLDDIETSTNNNGTLENSSGYHLGVVYELDLGPLAVRPGVRYRRVGEVMFSDEALPGGESQSEISAWEVPVDVRLSILPVPLLNPYLHAGPLATFPRGEDQDFDDAMEDVSYSLNVGAGANISLGSSLTLQPELSYEFGATRVFEDEFEIGGATFNPREEPAFSAFSLRLHVLF